MMKTLNDLKLDESATIESYSEGLLISYRERLEELGFTIGRTVVCTQKTAMGGPRLYNVGSSVYSLDKDTAMKICIH